MKERKTGNPDFINLWRKCKIEKLRDIERLCSIIMDVLQIAEKPSWNGIRAKETGNGDCAGKKHSSVKSIDWGNIFDKLERGEKVVGRPDFLQWYGVNWEGSPSWEPLFYKGELGDLDKEGFDHPLWIQIPPYGENINAFESIRDDCKMVSQFLESANAAYNGQYFKAVEDIVNGVIQGVFTLIGIHDNEHKITPKLRKYEARELADREGKAKGGRAPKKNAAIMGAVKAFILENKNLKTALTIAQRFKKHYTKLSPYIVAVDSRKYEVFCNADYVYSYDLEKAGRKGKYNDKSISYSTFVGRYIPTARKAAALPTVTSPNKNQ